MPRAIWIWLCCALASPVFAQAPAAREDLDARMDAFEWIFAPVDPDQSFTLLGPVASKIYAGDAIGPRLGLSADFFRADGGTDTTVNDPAGRHSNVVSVAPTFGYRLHPRLIFNSALDFATGGAERSDTVTLRRGAAVVRFAYLDWTFGSAARAGVRLGHQLIPVGLSNTSADAVTYFGVQRPELEREVLPADWHENGALAYYDEGPLTLEAGAFSSLNARGLRGESFLSGGRSQGQNAPSENVMAVVRLNSHDARTLVGGSVAFGDTAQGNVAIPAGTFRLGELHARYRRPRVELQAQIAQGKIQDAGLISVYNQTTLGEVAGGGSAHAAVEVLGRGPRRLWAYVRGTSYDLHQKVPAGFAANAALHRTAVQVGAHYVPVPLVVLKLDVVRRWAGDADAHHEIWAGAGFVY